MDFPYYLLIYQLKSFMILSILKLLTNYFLHITFEELTFLSILLIIIIQLDIKEILKSEFDIIF